MLEEANSNTATMSLLNEESSPYNRINQENSFEQVSSADDIQPNRGDAEEVSLLNGSDILPASRVSGTDNDERTATISSSVFNLSNTILGSGVLAMPHACSVTGLIGFVFCTVLSATAAHRAVVLLFETVKVVKGENEQRISYSELGERVQGSMGRLFASWSVTLQQFGACIAYVVIIGDIFTPVLGAQFPNCGMYCEREFIQIFSLVCIIFPLCLLKHMDSLKYTSLIALGCIVAFVIVFVANGIYVLSDEQKRKELIVNSTLEDPEAQYSAVKHMSSSDIHFLPNPTKAFSAIAVFAFAFLCHQNTFPIYNELKNPTVERMRRISKLSMVSCGTVYLFMGLFGYATFLSFTRDDVLKNFAVKDTYISEIMNVFRIAFGVSLIFSYPIVVWEARANLNDLVFGAAPYKFSRYLLLNISIISITGLIGVLADNIDQVLGLVGATCSPMMMFVLPPLFHLKSGAAAQQDSVTTSKVMLVFGILLIPICVAIWFVDNIIK